MINKNSGLESFYNSLTTVKDKINLITKIYYWSHLVDFQKTGKGFLYNCNAADKFAMFDPYGNLFFCPLLKEKTEVDNKVRQIKVLKDDFDKSKFEAQKRLSDIPDKIERLKNIIEDLQEFISKRPVKPEKFAVTIDGKEITDKGKAWVKLVGISQKVGVGKDIGEYLGYTLQYIPPRQILISELKYGNNMVGISDSPQGTFMSLDYTIYKLPEITIQNFTKEIELLEKDLPAVESLAEGKFDKQELYEEQLKSQREIEKQIKNEIMGQHGITQRLDELSEESLESTEMYAGLPLPEQFKEIINKLLSKFDTKKSFAEIGAKETGLAIKVSISRIVAGDERILKAINDLGKFGLTKPDFTELAFISERPGLFLPLPEETRKLYSPAYHLIRYFFDSYYNKLKEVYTELEINAFELPFPQSHIRRMQEENLHIESIIETTTDEKKKAQLIKQVKDNKNLIAFYKKARIKYVHLPIRLWLSELFDKTPDIVKQIMKIIPSAILGRETPTLADLIEKLQANGIMSRDEVDIRDIMASYGRYVERKLAQAEIFRMAKKEGLIRPLSDPSVPDSWIMMSSRMYPELRGYKIHPVFATYLEKHQEAMKRHRDPVMRVLGYVKMLQFFNPVFLPMYDVVQFMMLTGIKGTISIPPLLVRAIKSVWQKDEAYFTARHWGLTSQPFANPFSEFMNKLQSIKKAQNNNGFFLINKLEKMGIKFTPWVWQMVYNVNWELAWWLDGVIRMMSYYYMLDRGFIPKEAAQLAAIFSGDYAGVPAETRKWLNRFFFTPTYKIAMTKLYLLCLSGGFKAIKGITGAGPGATPSDRVYARGLFYILAILYAKDVMMRKGYGFESDQFSRRYSKLVEIEKEERKEKRELVLTFANPANLMLRYYWRLRPEKTDTNYLLKVAKATYWELHPLYALAIELAQNRGYDFKAIRNPFDEPEIQAADVVKYGIGRIMRLVEPLLREEEKESVLTFKAMQKDMGTISAIIFHPFVFTYLRQPRDERVARQVNLIIEEFRKFAIIDPADKETMKKREKRLTEMIDALEGLIKENEEKHQVDFRELYKQIPIKR